MCIRDRFQTDQVWVKEKEEFRQFYIKKEIKEILFIAQQPELIRIVVLNDEDYSLMKSAQNSNEAIFTQNVDKYENCLLYTSRCV